MTSTAVAISAKAGMISLFILSHDLKVVAKVDTHLILPLNNWLVKRKRKTNQAVLTYNGG
jgi:hypothetical protein